MTIAGATIANRASLVVFAVADLNTAARDTDSQTVQEAVTALSLIRDAILTLRQLEAGQERWIAECFTAEGWRDPVELAGVGVVEVRRNMDRRAWQHDRIRSDWLNALMTARGGETLDPADVRDAFLDVASVGSYKVRALRALGLDPDDYCESQPGTPRVVIS